MWVEITTGTSIKGVPVNPGDIVDVDDASARTLIHYKLAEPASGDAIKKAVAKSAAMIEAAKNNKPKK